MSDYIPEEVVNEILVRLPAKSLIKFTGVCKSWRCLIKSSSFIAAHLQFNTENEDARLLFIAGSRFRCTSSFSNSLACASFWRFYCLLWDTPEVDAGDQYNTNLIAPPPFADETKTHLIGTCNGLVCMHVSSTRGRCIVLWNPSTRRYVCSPSPIDITTPEIAEESFGFGYDSVNNDYKVLRLATRRRVLAFTDKNYSAEVWSLAKGVWKSIISEKPQELRIYRKYLFDRWRNTCVNSTLHWLQFDNMNRLWSIATFNLVNESFGQIELPKGRDKSKSSSQITKCGDFLAYFENQGRCFDLWVMKEYAVAESWTILCTVDLRMVRIFRPFCFWRSGGELVLQVLKDQRAHSDQSDDRKLSLISVNLKSKQFENLGILHDGYPSELFVDSFTDGLVLLEQANAVSY